MNYNYALPITENMAYESNLIACINAHYQVTTENGGFKNMLSIIPICPKSVFYKIVLFILENLYEHLVLNLKM